MKDKFLSGEMSMNDLDIALDESERFEDKLILHGLLRSTPGHEILRNTKAHAERAEQTGASIPSPHALVKEGLCKGQIMKLADRVNYDTTRLSTMQRYAHAHFALLNFSRTHMGRSSQGAEAAIRQHFEGPLALSGEGNTVSFAEAHHVFNSAATGREIRVAAIEHLWENEGYSGRTQLGGMADTLNGMASTQVISIPGNTSGPGVRI